MTRQGTGRLLLALAVLGALVVARLGQVHGVVDGWLVAVSVVGVALTAGLVLGDIRRARRIHADAARRA